MPALTEDDILAVKKMRARKEPQEKPAMLPIQLRDSFDLIELTLTPAQAQKEAARCVQCSAVCDKCVEVCPNRANYTFLMSAVKATLPRLGVKDGALAVVGSDTFAIDQTRQILNVNDFCNECGDCETFCVHEGRPFTEKPRLFLTDEDFNLEANNAFRIEGDVMRRREGGQESRLTRANGHFVYENAHVRVSMTPAFTVKEMALKESFSGSLSLVDAAEMAVIFKGITDTLPMLLI